MLLHHLTTQATQVQQVQVKGMPSCLVSLGGRGIRSSPLMPRAFSLVLIPCSAVCFRVVLRSAGPDPALAPLRGLSSGGTCALIAHSPSPPALCETFPEGATGQMLPGSPPAFVYASARTCSVGITHPPCLFSMPCVSVG